MFGVQVSEVYSLHRQTAYLAQDYFDRFMLTQDDVGKEYLQLLGITALFIASKIEVSLAPPLAHPPTPTPVMELKPVANGPKTFLSLQEIYPPKVFDFAYVTDGACDVDDIQQTELHMLKVGR